jgi:hypothetical protein
MKIKLTSFVCCCLFMLCLPALAVMVNLSPQDTAEAIAFGTAHRGSIEKELDARYAFGSADPYAEGGVVHTRWYKLAYMAAQKAGEGSALSAQEQEEIVSDPCLQINIKIYGRSLDFARGYSVSLLQKEKVIKPEKQHADSFSAAAAEKKSLPGFPGYRAIMRCYFKYIDIDPAAPATLILKKDGRESRFSIDFTRYK